MELAAHLRRIGNDIVAAYLVDTEEGVTVIDAGLPGHYDDLVAELAAMGRTLDDVRGIIVTHGDADHLGFAERLRRDHGVPVFVHAGDAARAKGGPVPKTARPRLKLGPALRFLVYAIAHGGTRKTPLTDLVELNGGETLDLPGSPQILWMPGHSEGSIAVFVPLVDAVFVGDGLTTRHVTTGVDGPQPAPFTDEPARALDSLDVLLPTNATWVLPGHGAPWNGGAAAAVAAVRAAARG